MDDSERGSSWGGVGDAISAARVKAGLSAVQLSNRTRDLGVPIHRVAISKIESGERDVTVSELVVLSVALDTAPVMLIFPGPYENSQEGRILPDLVMSKFDAAQWFSGELDSPTPVSGADFYQYRNNLKPLRNARIVHELRARQRSLLSIIGDHEGDGSREVEVIRNTLGRELAGIEADISRYTESGETDA